MSELDAALAEARRRILAQTRAPAKSTGNEYLDQAIAAEDQAGQDQKLYEQGHRAGEQQLRQQNAQARQQQRDAEKAARELDRANKAAAEAAQRERNNQLEAQYRRAGREHYTDADGNIQATFPDEEHNRRIDADLAKKAEADQRAKDAEARRLRAVEINTAQHALQRQEQTFSRQQQQLDLEDNTLRISQREADNAIAAHKAKENSAADYDAWSAELGRLQATKADLDAKSIDVARRKQTVGAARLKWEEQTDPQRQALTGEEITLPIATAQELTADRVETVPAGTQQPAVPPTVPAAPPADPSATLTARALAAETRPDLPLEQRQTAADLIRLRRDNPAAWLQTLAADREALPFEELDQQVRAQVASFQQRQAAVQAAGAQLQQQQQAVLAPIQDVLKRNAALLAGGYTDANTVTLYDEAGRVQRLHKSLVPEYNQLVQIGQQKQQASAAEIAKYEAERAELQQEQVAVQQALNDLRRRHQQRQTEASQARKTELQSIEQRAGKPGLAADLEKLDEQERQRLASVNMDSPAGQQAAREIQADVAKQRDAQLPENMRRTAAADAYRRQPGMAPIADRLEQAQAKADKRRQEIEQRTADPVQRRLALQSLEDENKQELDSIQKEAAERQEAGAKLYNEWGARLNVVDWTSEDIGPRLRQEAEARGFTEAEARQLLDLHRKADWSRPLSGPEAQRDRADGITLLGRSVAAIASDSDDWSSLVEPVRTLPNGALTVNPGLYGSEKAYMAAVQAAPASPAAKEAARAAFPELQQQWAATVLPILQQEMNIPGLPSFNAWSAEKKADPAFAAKPEAQQALDYIAEVRSRGTAHKYLEIITRRLGSGLIQLGAAAVGILGMTTPPSAVMSESAAWLNRKATAIGGATGSKGLGDDVWQRSTGLLAELTPQIAAQIGTGALGGGLKTAAVVAAGQTAGMQYASTYDQLRQQGKTHLQAWTQSAPGALASGIVTGMLTRLGGNTGPEALLRTLQGEAGKKALREALSTGWKSTWSKAASLAKHAGGEVAEELPDELFSQLSEVVSLKGENLQMADLIGTIDQFVRSAPELMIAVGAMGGSAGAVRDAADRATVRNILRPEQLRQAAAEIDNVQIPGVEPQETAAAQRRATVALALADGSELQDISEADLNAAGWTRLNKDGQQDAAGTLTALKGYTGPSILEVRSDGKVRLNREYATRLREYMPTVAEAIPPRLFDWHTPTPSTTEKPSAATPSQPKAPLPGTVPAPQVAATAPAAGSPSAGGSQAGQPVTPTANAPAIQTQPGPVGSPAGNATQPSAQATAGAGIQPASDQPNPGQTGPAVAAPDSIEAAAANLPGDLPTDDPRVQRAWEIANHLEAAGMERTAANKIAAETLRRQGVNGRDVNVQVTAPQFATLLDELGVTGDRRSQEGTPPLTAPTDLDSRLSRVAQPAATSKPPAPSAARPLPAPSGITPQAGAAPAVSGTGSAEGAASAPPAGAAPAPAAQPAPTNSAPNPAVDLSDILTKWRNREATDADVVRAAMERSGSTNSKDLIDILIEAAGWYPQRAKLAVAAVLTKQPGGVDLTDPGLAGDSIPLGAARREGTQLGTVSTPGTAAAPSPNADSANRNLGTQAAWSRARTFALSRIKDPKRRAWARKAISATEAEIAANSGLFDALIVGPLARAMNGGAAFSVERTPQGIALVTDLNAVLAQMAYIGNPTAAIRATMAEEAIHGAQKRLEQAKPDRWSPGKLASLWRDLPEAVRQKAWQAYNAQSVSGAPDVPGRNYASWMQWRQGQMPAEMSDAEAYQMASEFLRMLVQGSIDPNSVTESVDPNPSLVARIKALLADLYNVLRGLIKGLPPQQATDLDGMVSELRTALERGRTASSPARTAQLQFLRDSKAVASQAMRTGALYTELAKGDRLFTDDGLRSIWGRLTPELQRAVFALRAREQVGLTGHRSRADKAELMRDLLAILTHPDAGPELAQTLLENTPHAVAANNILRRALNAVRRHFAGTPTQSLLEALKRAPVEDLQLLRQLRAQTTYAWAQFEATAQVQQTQEPVPAATAAAGVNAPDSGDDDRRRKAAAEALARQMAQDEQRRVLQRATVILEMTLGRPAGTAEPAGPPAPIDTAIKSAEESANAMVEAWMQRQALEQIADPAERARALAKFDREQRLDPVTQQQRWDSMDEAQQALEAALAENSTPAAAQALKRRLAHQAYVARRMLEFALQELGALPSYEQTVPAALLRVGRGEITLGTAQSRRTISRSSPEGAPVRMVGTSIEGALNALGIEINDDGTLYTSSPDTPAYVERNQIIIRQSTLDSIGEDLPMLRRMLPESEAAQRRALGLPRTPAGTTIDDIVASRMEAARERTRRQQNMRIRNLERSMGLGEFSGELTGPLLDPAELAGPMRGGGTDIISWLPNNHGSLGWPAENSGGEWDWFRDLLREYYSPTTLGRTELRQRYRAGKVIGSELVTVGLGTKLGMTNTAKKMASLGNLSTPAALVEWLIDKGIVTPPDPTEKVRSTDLLENQAAAGDITTAETAALDDNIPIPEGIGNAVMAAIEARIKARAANAVRPEAVGELQALRFERDAGLNLDGLKGEGSIEVGEIWRQAQDAPSVFITLRRRDGSHEQTPLTYVDEAWYSVEESEFQEGSPYFRRDRNGYAEQLWVILDGGTYYGRNQIPATATLQYGTPGNTDLNAMDESALAALPVTNEEYQETAPPTTAPAAPAVIPSEPARQTEPTAPTAPAPSTPAEPMAQAQPAPGVPEPTQDDEYADLQPDDVALAMFDDLTSGPSLQAGRRTAGTQRRNALRVKLTRAALTERALEQASWRDWYRRHKETLDEFFAEDAPMFQKLLAITSQAANVKTNVVLALKAYRQLKLGEPFQGYLPAVITNLDALRTQVAVGGQKINAYLNANEGDEAAVVVDRHIARMLFGVTSPSAAQFQKAARVLTEIADSIGWTPAQVQAALWADSIVRSGKTPVSYDSYLRRLHETGTLAERLDGLAGWSRRSDGNSGNWRTAGRAGEEETRRLASGLRSVDPQDMLAKRQQHRERMQKLDKLTEHYIGNTPPPHTFARFAAFVRKLAGLKNNLQGWRDLRPLLGHSWNDTALALEFPQLPANEIEQTLDRLETQPFGNAPATAAPQPAAPAPRRQRPTGEPPADILRQQAKLSDDELKRRMGIEPELTGVAAKLRDDEADAEETEVEIDAPPDLQANFWPWNHEDYRAETRETPTGSPYSSREIKAIAPYLISGNKGDLIGLHGNFYSSLARGASSVLDAFGGAAIYTHYLATQKLLPPGSIWNEWEYTRSITNRQIANNPDEVVAEIVKIRESFRREFPTDRTPTTREGMLKVRDLILQWLNARLESMVDARQNDSAGRLPLPDTPRMAAFYLFVQTHMAENRVVDIELTKTDRKPRLFTGGKVNGKDDLRFINWNQDKGVEWQENLRTMDTAEELKKFLRESSRRLQMTKIQQGDGWKLAAHAPAGSLVFVDTSYFPSDDQIARRKAVMNYGTSTLGDGHPKVWLKKFEKNLLPKGEEVRYVITNNFNSEVVHKLEQAGWSVLQTHRGTAKKPSYEFIALSPAAARSIDLPQATGRTLAPGGLPIAGRSPSGKPNAQEPAIGLPAGKLLPAGVGDQPAVDGGTGQVPGTVAGNGDGSEGVPALTEPPAKTALAIAQFNKQVEDDRRAREQWERDLYQNAPKELKDTDPDWADQMSDIHDRWADKQGLEAARRIPADTFPRVQPPTAKEIRTVLRAAIAQRPPDARVFDDGYRLTERGLHQLRAGTRVYHGTPHKVDKFRTSAIGTGEGAQIFGYGLYFAQERKVAEGYQKALTQRDAVQAATPEAQLALSIMAGRSFADAVKAAEENLHAMQRKYDDFRLGRAGYTVTNDARYLEELRADIKHAERVWNLVRTPRSRWPESVLPKAAEGNLYTVELLPDEAEFADWDKLVSEQPAEVQKRIKAALGDHFSYKVADGRQKKYQAFVTDPTRPWLAIDSKGDPEDFAAETREEAEAAAQEMNKAIFDDQTFEEIHSQAAQTFGAKETAEMLLKAGIPGIRYLDANSRSSELQTHNFVIFDDNLVRILEENGQPVGDTALRAAQRAASADPTANSRALTIYRKLTAERDRLQALGKTLTADQAQRLEQAERELGQVFFDFATPPARADLRLESEPLRTSQMTRTPSQEQLPLFASHRWPQQTVEEARAEMQGNGTDADYKGGNAWLSPDNRWINLGHEPHYSASETVLLNGYGPAMAAGYVRIAGEYLRGSKWLFAEFFGPTTRRIQREISDAAIMLGIEPTNVTLEPNAERHYGDPDYDEPALQAAKRTPAKIIEDTGLAPAISVNGMPYTGQPGMFHPAIMGDYVWRKVYSPQQRRDDPAQTEAGRIAFDEWMDEPGSGFDDFGFLDTRSGKFVDRTEAYRLLTERGFAPPADSTSARYKELDSSDLFNSTPTSAGLAAARRIQRAAQDTDTNPTEAQKQAGNYRKGKVSLHGLTISLENPRGSERSGTDANGKTWSVTMPHHYGYILGTVGKDKDHIDAFIGPDPAAASVYVVNQRKPGNGHFDEHKVMLGFPTAGAAARGYMDSYTPGWRGFQSMVVLTVPEFKTWLANGDKTKEVTRESAQAAAALALQAAKRPTGNFPSKPNMDEYRTWKGSKQERDAEWQRWRDDINAWEKAVAEFANQQGNLGGFISPIKHAAAGRPYRQSKIVTRIPGTATQWRTTTLAQNLTTPDNKPAGDWADNAWVPLSHDEFASKPEAYIAALDSVDNDWEFTTQPLFSGARSQPLLPPTISVTRKGGSGLFYGTHAGGSTKITLPTSGEGIRIIPGTENDGDGANAPLADAVNAGQIQPPAWLRDLLADKSLSDSTWDHDLIGALSLHEQGVQIAHFPDVNDPSRVVSVDLRRFDKAKALTELRGNLLPAGEGDPVVLGSLALRSASRTLNDLLAENTTAAELTNIDLIVYRVGPLRDFTAERGVYFGSDPDSIKSYSGIHPGHAIKPWQVQARRAFVAHNLHQAWQTVYGKRLDLNEIDIRLKLQSTAKAGRWADEKLAKTLRSRGFDALIYRKPAPPAKHEIALIGKTAQATPIDSTSLRAGSRIASDAAYLAAVQRGDMEAAQRMVDEAANAAGFSNEKLYHGTTRKKVKSIDPRMGVEIPGAAFLTDNPDMAEEYTYPREYGEPVLYDEDGNQIEPGVVVEVFARLQNPLVVDMGGGVGDTIAMSRAVRQAKQEGRDSVVFENVRDGLADSDNLGRSIAIFSPGQIKSADPVTYDDAGNVIPLSQRFDSSSPSILRAANRIAAASFNHIDRAMSSAVGRMATTAASTEPAAALANTVATWYRQDRPDANLVRATKELIQKELLPETVLPREVTAAMREMNMRIALGQQKALDVTRAMSGTPKFSDLAYPEEFVENPMHREQLFDAMEGRLDMASLPPAIQAVGNRLRAMLAEAGREAVAAGRMSPDTFEGLRTTYMPRYTREDAEANSADLAGFLKRFKLGVHDVLAQRSTAFHIVDTSRKDKTGQAAIVSPPGRSWRFPSQQALDAYYEELIERETLTAEPDWMTRADKKLHRSLTAGHLKAPASMSKDQVALVRRIQLGLRNQYRKEKPYTPKDLIRDPIYAVTRYLAESAQDNATAEFFRLVADNPKWVSDVELKGFKQIPDSPRFGALAGKWVQGDIASQVTEMADAANQALRLYESLLRLWKAGKTVLNPATHGRNLMGNVPFSVFAGTNVLNPANAGYYWRAFSLLRQGGPQLVELYEAGVLGADYGTVELRTALEGIVPPPPAADDTDVMKQLIALGNRAAAWARVRSVPAALVGATTGAAIGAAAGGLPGAAVGAVVGAFSGPLYRAATLAYRLEDEVFKIAAFLKAKDMGMTAEQAADHVRAWFPFYDKATSTTIKAATLTVMPFSSFYRESARIFAKAAKERPLALASTIAIPSIITAVSTALLGLSKEDEDEVRKDMRGKGAKLLGATPLAGIPLFAMLLPIRTADGSLVQMDLTGTHPFADFLSDRVENTQNMPWWQTWSRSLLANPMLGLLYTASTGKDPFGDRTLWDSSYTDAEKAAALFGHAWKTAVPPLTPGGTNWQMLENAGRRQANKTLAIRNPMQSIARALVGLDFRSADPNIYRLADEYRQARNLSATYDGMQAFPTDAAGRARKAIFEELVQPTPDADKLTDLLQRLNDLGTPVRSVKDVLKILDRRRPDAVINPKELRSPFRAAQAPEAKRVLDTALQEFARARSATPAAFAEARKRLNASTRPATD